MILYGAVAVDIDNRIEAGTYECHPGDSEPLSLWYGIALPLTGWLGETSFELNAEIDEFCRSKTLNG